MGKSAAKIRRNQARAAARGECYTPPLSAKKTNISGASQNEDTNDVGDQSEVVSQAKLVAAQNLESALAELESKSGDLNSKERRSLKRKAEAIASEAAGCSAHELLEWYKDRKRPTATKSRKKQRGAADGHKDNLTLDLSEEDLSKQSVAKKLFETLSKLESDDKLNAKERRSAKRKAEAIASEEAGCAATELLEWYKKQKPHSSTPKRSIDSNKEQDAEEKRIPYIVFVGQLSYSTSVEQLFDHFKSSLGPEVITKESAKIRLLTDPKTNKSRGMAFVEVDNPATMYECLKLHLTHLDGRRINVERSSGGGVAAKKSRISNFRESQSHYISTTIDNIISDSIKNGDIQENELDEGVISLCKRHSATVIEHAIKEYVEEKRNRKDRKEKSGENDEEEFRNPSAYLTHIIGRVAEEGAAGSGETSRGSNRGKQIRSGRGGPGRGHTQRRGFRTNNFQIQAKEEGISQEMFSSRGRGRGRGYM